MLSPARQPILARSLFFLAFLAALAFACVLFCAIPWLTVPTIGQAIWASGFAQSYANAGGLTIYATDFGLPMPAPISFGLSATFVQGLLIRAFGIAAIDAYTLTIALYLALALYGAAAMARLLGASRFQSLAIGLLWLAVPITWEHVAYSMLALGFALLPMYLHSASMLFVAKGRRAATTSAVWFIFTCTLSVFMDGYTFVMFFAASAILCIAAFLTDTASRRHTTTFVLPIMALGFFLAYFLYTHFIGDYHYHKAPLTFFRGWGVDVTMLLGPTRGIHWLWDALGLSVTRSDQMFWGDASVWMTTFLAPLLLSGLLGYFASKDRKRAAMLLVMALLGLYLSLGPSLKIQSTKQVANISQEDRGVSMPERYALAPTGSSWISEHVPGFRDMRAAYRWIGLGALGLWALTALLLARVHDRRPVLSYALVTILIVSFLPHATGTLRAATSFRARINTIPARLGNDLRVVSRDHGILFFAPYDNDFLANYLAATSGFRTYNIGGDKNLEMARLTWSEPMRKLNVGNLADPGFRDDLRSILLLGSADLVILPYFDMLQDAMLWPPSSEAIHAKREARWPIAQSAAGSPCFEAREFPMFAAVSLNETGRQVKDRLLSSSGDEDSNARVVAACRLTN